MDCKILSHCRPCQAKFPSYFQLVMENICHRRNLLWFLCNNLRSSRVAPATPSFLFLLPYPTLPSSVPSEWYTCDLVFTLKVVGNESIRSRCYHGRFRSDRGLGRYRPRSGAQRQRQG